MHQYFATNETGGATRSYEFAKNLSGNNINTTVITATNPALKNEDNFKVISTKTAYSNNMSFLKRVFSFFAYNIKAFLIGLRQKNIDLIFATSTPLTIGLPAVLLKKIKRTKLIFEVRDVWPDVPIELGYIKNQFMIWILKKLEMWIYSNSEHIIVLSEGMLSNLIVKGINPTKISVIENIANLYLYDQVKDTNKYIGMNEKFICIHPGTMGHVNGLDFVLDVAKIVKEKDNSIVFLLIGDGKRKEMLIERAKNENLTNVIFDIPKPKKEIAQIIKSSDIGIMCVDNKFKILEDNSANKFFDFLAAGLPVLINYGGWQKEALESSECGYSCLTPQEMADKILLIKNEPTKMVAMSKNSRKLAEDRYSDLIAKNKLKGIIESSINNKR